MRNCICLYILILINVVDYENFIVSYSYDKYHYFFPVVETVFSSYL